jgi:hypothetical protein
MTVSNFSEDFSYFQSQENESKESLRKEYSLTHSDEKSVATSRLSYCSAITCFRAPCFASPAAADTLLMQFQNKRQQIQSSCLLKNIHLKEYIRSSLSLKLQCLPSPDL